jgi:glutathione S-transferase
MQTPATPNNHLLLAIPFSHYNEKARWAFAYYGVPYSQQLLLPVFHILSLRTVANRSPSKTHKQGHSSPYSTPCLVVSTGSPPTTDKTFHDSHDILVYLSENFSCPVHPHLYTCCGVDQADQIRGLEKRYDEVLGIATRSFAYYEIVVLNRWRALLPFALLGFTNGVGLLQSMLWFLWSPLIGKLLVSKLGSTPKHHRSMMEICRAEFECASRSEFHDIRN